MVVLVVDDQTHIVNGLVGGIQWKRLGISKVLKAYNSYEAKEIIEEDKIDILITDIEMPVESGLDLFRWTKEENKDIVCIFLTSHDDFIYTREAISLGGFDYILQPASYRHIERSISNALLKVKKDADDRKYYEYGKLLYEEKEYLIHWFLRDWFRGNDIEDLEEKLRGFNIRISAEDWTYFVIINILEPENNNSSDLLGIISEINSSIFKNYGQNILLTQIDNGDYAFLVYPEGKFQMDKQALIRQLKLFISILDKNYDILCACYTSDKIGVFDVVKQVEEVKKLRDRNVALLPNVFSISEKENCIINIENNININMLKEMLRNGNCEGVIMETDIFLKKMVDNQQLNETTLKMFYQTFTQMLSNVLGGYGLTLNDMFSNEEELDFAFSSHKSVKNMRNFILYTTNYFSNYNFKENNDESRRIDEIIEYIRINIDSDITREDIANAVYLNPNYLSRYFKSEMGITLKEFIINEKMRVAKNLIKTTQLPIGVIAAKVGYANFSYFSHVYKSTYDVTPSEDRKSYK